MKRLLIGIVALVLIFAVVMLTRPLNVLDAMLRFSLWKSGVHSGYVTLHEARVHYFEGGSGKPIVLVHGLGARGEDWAGMMPRLMAAGYHVYAPDLLGYGRTDRPLDSKYSIGTQEALITQFMDAMKLQQADVAGWSMGGWIAMTLTIDHPERVRRLVVYDTAGMYWPMTFSPDLFTPKDGAEVERLKHTLEPSSVAVPDWVVGDILRRNHQIAWVMRRTLDGMLNGRELLDFRAPSIKVPMLIMWGQEDMLIPPSVGERLHVTVPQSELEMVANCGHLAPSRCAPTVADATVEFLNSEPALARGEKQLVGEPH